MNISKLSLLRLSKIKKNNFFYINLKTFYYAYIESKTFDGPRMLNLMK